MNTRCEHSLTAFIASGLRSGSAEQSYEVGIISTVTDLKDRNDPSSSGSSFLKWIRKLTKTPDKKAPSKAAKKAPSGDKKKLSKKRVESYPKAMSLVQDGLILSEEEESDSEKDEPSNSKKAVVGASLGIVAALAVAGTVSAIKRRKVAAKDEEDDETAETEIANTV